ncbi:MAG TPA: aquaporin [Vicinamibacterales bacterium]|nr:aquaporin [Vicinamibacterales bacterium]
MNRYLTEFVGTFFLVLTIGCTVFSGAPGVIPPLAIGAVLMVMVYAGAHISGAHYNPAITIAVYVRGRFPASDIMPYVGMQLAGAGLAALTALWLLGKPQGPGGPLPAMGPALLAEFLFTFALAWVVLNVATAKDTAGNSFYGVAIGMTVTAGAFAVGHISGAVFNPAVAIGISLMGLSGWSNMWMYLLGTIGGAVVGAIVFKAANPGDH